MQTITANTSHSVTLQPITAGQLLVVHIRFSGAPGTVTFTGWTQFAASTSDASDDDDRLFYRLGDGTETRPATLTTGNSIKASGQSCNVNAAADPAVQPPEVSTVVVGTSANTASGGSLSPAGGAKDYLWLTFMGQDGETAGGVSAAPANYNAGGLYFRGDNSGTGGAAASNNQTGIAGRQLNAASEDPGAFTHVAPANGWTAWTVAIHPAGPAATSLVLPNRAQSPILRTR